MRGFLIKIFERKNLIKAFLLISIVLTLIDCTLIGEKIPLENLIKEFKGELKSIQNTPWSFNKIDFKSYDYENPGFGKITFFNFNKYNSYFNIDKLQIRIDDDNNYILEDMKDGTFTNIFSFEYITSKKQNKGLFKFITSSMRFSKNFYQKNNYIEQSVETELNLKLVSVDLPDEAFRRLIEIGLDDFLNKVASDLIKKTLENDVNDFYLRLNKKNSEENNTLILKTTYPNNEFKLNIGFDKVPQLISPLTNFTLFSLSGSVNNITHNITLLPKFIFDNDTLIEFTVSRIIFKDVIDLMTNNGLFNYSINEKNIFKESLFDLNIEYLSNIIPEIDNSYSRTQEVNVYNVVKEVIYNKNIKNQFIINVIVETQIINKFEDNIIFKFNHTLAIELKQLFNNTDLNFYIDRVFVEEIKIITDSYSFVNLSLLKQYISNYYSLYFNQNKKFMIFKSWIDLSWYCNNVVDNTFTEYGFNLLFDSKVKFYLKNDIREKALKFLEKII